MPMLMILSGCSSSSYAGTASSLEQTEQEIITDTAAAISEIDTNEPDKFGQAAESAVDYGPIEKAQSGPTVYLFGEDGQYPDNALADFMYFVPLISPVGVSAVTSRENTQGGHLLSFESETKGKRFYVSCEFRMKGKGSFANHFDDDAMIVWNTAKESKKVLKNILDYIKFEGEGYGRIEAGGKISDGVATADYVNVYFNARGAESPVSVGLYDIDLTKKTDGHYKQYNHKVARVNVLSFERSKTAPMLELKIAAVGKSEDKLGTWAHIVGSIGNWFIEPIEVDKLGNDTMLDFGARLYEKEPSFTFPIAKNLKKLDS